MISKLSLFAIAAFAVGCSLGGHPPAEYSGVVRDADASQSAPPTLAQDEKSVGQVASLDAITRIALARSPTVLEARARTRAALARAKATGRLPDLEFKYELWGQPLDRPWALGQAQMHMFGLRQSFPAAGSLDAQAAVAMEEAKVSLQVQHARELDVIAEVRKAWSAYWAADREKAIHLDHVEITGKLVEFAKVQLQVGKASPSDVLRLSVELTRLHADIVSLDAQLVTSRAKLNSLMARDLDAPLGPPPEPRAIAAAPNVEVLRKIVLAKRPELAAAAGAVKKSEAAVDVAKSEAHVPTVMLGADYQLMPTSPMPHNFGVMILLGLPWLNARRSEEVKAAEATLAADKEAAKAMESVILLQLREALVRYDAARAMLAIVEEKLLPQSQKAYEVSHATWSAGGGDSLGVVDSLRTWLAVRLDRSRAAMNVEIALGDLERALGAPIPAAGAKS